MRRWTPALIIIAGVVASVVAWVTLDLVYACLVSLATISYAAYAPSVIGNTSIPSGATPDAALVRRWREEHPDATISDAIAATTKH